MLKTNQYLTKINKVITGYYEDITDIQFAKSVEFTVHV
jgi:hypothetical protein